ncbi:MAG: T9SS type A sorting domain-containing protein, partial [Phycisphaerae bacterium]|nr:T9SS type A sorting domain-containing protein [Saprospiraceae bacterium]
GQKLLQQEVNTLSETILVPTHSLAKGLYLIRIESKQGIRTLKAMKS